MLKWTIKQTGEFESESSKAKFIALTQSIYGLWYTCVKCNFTMLKINIIIGIYVHLTHMVHFEIGHQLKGVSLPTD